MNCIDTGTTKYTHCNYGTSIPTQQHRVLLIPAFFIARFHRRRSTIQFHSRGDSIARGTLPKNLRIHLSRFPSTRPGGPPSTIFSRQADGSRRRGRCRARERRREGRVNNLHSDESIVLRQAHATVPIMALRLVDASTTNLLFSSPPLSLSCLSSPYRKAASSLLYIPPGYSSFLLLRSCSFLRGYRPAAGSFSPREF